MLRKFMYLSIGILALAVAFQMGATVARSSVDCVAQANIPGNNHVSVITTNGTIQGWSLASCALAYETGLPRPGIVVASHFGPAAPTMWVLYADGEMYSYTPSTGWQLRFDVACGPISIQPSTWGHVKQEFKDATR